MTKISARVAAAHRANALGINGPLILSVTRVLDKHAAFAGVEAGVARGASGEDAIHHVNAQRDVVADLFRAADAHEIAWAVLRQKCGYFGGHFASHLVRFANSKAPDGVPRKIQIEK